MKTEKGTIARTICLAIALLNQILTSTGFNPLDISDDTVYQLCTLGATVIFAVRAFWKNNSFTKAAKKADLDLKKYKALGE